MTARWHFEHSKFLGEKRETGNNEQNFKSLMFNPLLLLPLGHVVNYEIFRMLIDWILNYLADLSKLVKSNCEVLAQNDNLLWQSMTKINNDIFLIQIIKKRRIRSDKNLLRVNAKFNLFSPIMWPILPLTRCRGAFDRL